MHPREYYIITDNRVGRYGGEKNEMDEKSDCQWLPGKLARLILELFKKFLVFVDSFYFMCGKKINRIYIF